MNNKKIIDIIIDAKKLTLSSLSEKIAIDLKIVQDVYENEDSVYGEFLLTKISETYNIPFEALHLLGIEEKDIQQDKIDVYNILKEPIFNLIKEFLLQ